MVNKCRALYYDKKIDEVSGDTRKLYNIVDGMMNRKKDNSLPERNSDEELANEFGTFLKKRWITYGRLFKLLIS